jgi:hypothetical protein
MEEPMDKTPAAHTLPKLGDIIEGGIYAGVTTNKEGQLYMLVLLNAKAPGDLEWKPAMAWAASVEGDLPTRVEAALLFANVRSQLAKEWHWTNEEHESDASYAWLCSFGNGNQDDSHKGAEGAAVAVRRLPLQSFDPLESAVKRTAADVARLRSTAQALVAACDSIGAPLE